MPSSRERTVRLWHYGRPDSSAAVWDPIHTSGRRRCLTTSDLPRRRTTTPSCWTESTTTASGRRPPRRRCWRREHRGRGRAGRSSSCWWNNASSTSTRHACCSLTGRRIAVLRVRRHMARARPLESCYQSTFVLHTLTDESVNKRMKANRAMAALHQGDGRSINLAEKRMSWLRKRAGSGCRAILNDHLPVSTAWQRHSIVSDTVTFITTLNSFKKHLKTHLSLFCTIIMATSYIVFLAKTKFAR